jgi:hypothetical protein
MGAVEFLCLFKKRGGGEYGSVCQPGIQIVFPSHGVRSAGMGKKVEQGRERVVVLPPRRQSRKSVWMEDPMTANGSNNEEEDEEAR